MIKLMWTMFLREANTTCWYCSVGRCGEGPKDNLCSCCRHNHAPH